ncbi:AimR family lysis-lysogeny pheromone receptor [Bacillus horti]|uniref:Transcriptional regulator with XRE-family HTH domain n=1 Tax=Caldalkalibacillus horti TaxID=77523 RepID=A0ABT9W5H4_9BACI|nr:AimR family lysis-lysogeny pheromone receptor [Bacillus horti]MDQ0168490.1 transcriptional regulator with XRE-family HTH domain [Bacillus horti]
MLRTHILNQLDRKRIGQRNLAKIAGVSESTISRFLNDRDELNFESILKIVKFLFPEKEKEYIEEYATTQKSMNARYCMEYCMIHRLWHITEGIIATLYDSTNPLDREWARVYELELLRVNKRIEYGELLTELKRYYPKAIEVQILHTFVTAYAYYDMNKHSLLYDLLEGLDQQIEQVKSPFMRDCFNIRLGLLLNRYFLLQNKVEQAREYSYKVINQDVAEHVKGLAYLYLGESYLYEDYETGKAHIEKAYLIFVDTERAENARHAQQSLSFLQSYWKVDREFLLELDSDRAVVEYSHYLLGKDEKVEAKKMLDTIDVENLPDWDKGFFYYSLGLLEKHELAFHYSVKWFKKTENAFHLQLALHELKKMETNEVLLEILNL